MTRTVEFIFDFVSPNAYLAWYPLKGIVDRTGAELVITPAFLGGMHQLTGNQPPMITYKDVKGKNAYLALDMQRWQRKHGLGNFRMNPHFPFMSVPVLRLLLAAMEEGRGTAFIDLMLPKVWEDGIDAADKDALRTALEDSAFDADALFARAEEDDLKQQLKTNTANAVDRGAFGIPTFFVGKEMFFGKDRLDWVEEELAA